MRITFGPRYVGGFAIAGVLSFYSAPVAEVAYAAAPVDGEVHWRTTVDCEWRPTDGVAHAGIAELDEEAR